MHFRYITLAALLLVLSGHPAKAEGLDIKDYFGPQLGQAYIYDLGDGNTATYLPTEQNDLIVTLDYIVHPPKSIEPENTTGIARHQASIRVENNQFILEGGRYKYVLLDTQHPVWIYPFARNQTIHFRDGKDDERPQYSIQEWDLIYAVCSITGDRMGTLFGKERRLLDVTCKYTEKYQTTSTYVHTFASGIGPVCLYSSSPTSEDGLCLMEIRDE